MKVLRDYQQEAVYGGNAKFPGILPALREHKSTLLVMATGLGKSVAIARVANEWQHGNVLCLAHRIELCDQLADHLKDELGYRPSVEQGPRGLSPETLFAAGSVVVGSIQSMITGRRRRKFQDHPFGLIVIDECFPAGTQVDGRNIEDIGEGDMVTSFFPMSGMIAFRKVVRIFRKPAPSIMVRITARQRTVTATWNHPFLTDDGWIDAGRIKVGDRVCGMWWGPQDIARVDSVEILECGSADGPGSVCPDDCVYNLEIEGEHTYLANGFVVHNCHRATGASYQKLIEIYREIDPECRLLGATATPHRTDGTALGLTFESVAYEMEIAVGVGTGWLADIHQKFAVVEDLDLSKIPCARNEFGEMDFKPADLENLLSQEGPLHAMSRPVLDCTANGEQAIIFAASVTHAHLWTAVLNHYRPGCAAAVDGTMARGENTPRTQIVERYKAGELQFLLNYGIFGEGFDAPATKFIIMGRPTKSVLVYTQQLGRCTRPLPGILEGLATPEERKDAIAASAKPFATVLDFVGNSMLKVVTATDVLGGNFDVDIRAGANKIIGARGNANVLGALEKARASLLLEAEEEKRRPIRNAVQQTDIAYSLHDVHQYSTVSRNGKPKTSRGGATDAQVAALVNFGVAHSTAISYDRRQAGAVLNTVRQSRCTIRQARTLVKFGFDPTEFNAITASEQITEIANNGWKWL